MKRLKYILYRIMSSISVLKKKIYRPGADDFDWRWYHLHYQAEVDNIKRDHTQMLSPGDYNFSGGVLSLKSNVLPLHPNHLLLYETILQLNPTSVLEVGCGGGDHLSNLSVLGRQTSIFVGAIYQTNNYPFCGVDTLI